MKKLFTLLFLFAFVQLSFGQLSGNYNIGAGETYTTLKAACDDVMLQGVGGNITFYITSDLTEPANVGLAVNTAGFTITFKPSVGVVPTITYTQTADNAGSSGAWVIGLTTASGAPLVPTHNIVIDGSNTVGGTTRDLTFVSASGTNAYPFRIRGDNDNITIKNCIMTAGLSTIAYGIWVNPVFTSPNNYVPDNITIENCSITATTATAGCPIHISRTGTTTLKMENLIVRNNTLIARHRGVFLQGLTNVTTIENNIFEVNQTASGMLSGVVEGNVIDAGGVTYIFRNDFKQNSTANITAGTWGIRTITASGGGTFIIANNFFRGFSAPYVESRTTEIIGIRCGSAVEAYFNTFVMNNIDATTGSLYRGISIAAGTPVINNNIIITEEDDFVNYCITGTPGSSDYNNFYCTGTTNAKVGLYTGVPQATLADWQTASSQDANSVSKAVTFVSATDLHLSGGSLGDVDLIGTPLGAPYNVDIDGEARHTSFPYMGADENLANPLPVELTSFSASVIGSKVKLNWQTATEINNYGFEIQRQAHTSTTLSVTNWEKIGSVNGAGNSNSPKSYSYTDESASTGKFSYRLKQIDNDGTFEFSKAIEVDLGIPKEFQLSQNYPNPFNPTTKIQYALPVDAQVTLQIYSITGELMESLVSDYQSSGSYTIDFEGRNYASGTYIYRLIANDYVQTKKMILIK